MHLRRFAIFLTLAITAAGRTNAQPTPKTSLLVLSKLDQTLAIVDPANLHVVARIPVGNDPHEVIASADGTRAYVSNYGFGAYHSLAVVDLTQQKALPSIDVWPLRGPHGLAFVQGKVWFTAEASKVIARFDPATNKVDWIMGIGQNRTHLIYVFPKAKRIVTTNVNSGTVTILNRLDVPGGVPSPGAAALPGLPQGAILPPGGDWLPTVIHVGTRDEGFDVSPDGQEAWVGNAGDGTISVINIAEKKVVATLHADVPTANRLKFTPDGKRVLVSMMKGSDLVILDTTTRNVLKRIPVGHGGAGILIQPDGRRAYVSCPPDNYVAVIDLKTLAVVGHIHPGRNPDGLAWAVRR
jgi:YVTN family beta-propeller protein